MPLRVLLIAYYFPPLGGAGIGRPLALFKRMNALGIECDVLTVKKVAYRLYETNLLDDLDIRRIYRAGSFDPQRIMGLLGMRQVSDKTVNRGRKASELFFPDPKIGWVPFATRLARTLAENKKYNCVVSTSPPISAHLVGMKVAREYGLPWIADFRDFWTGYKAEDWYNSSHKIKKARQLLSGIKAEASEITATNPAIADYLGKGQVIYNSFDETRAVLWNSPTAIDKFRIGVLGTIDELRPIKPLLVLLAGLREKSPDLFEKIEIHQVGQMNLPGAHNELIDYNMNDKVILHGWQGREETINLLSSTAALYLGLSDYGEGILPGRFFDMLASGRTLLAAVPPNSVVEKLIQQTGAGISFNETSMKAARTYLSTLIDKSAKGVLRITPLPEYSRQFTSAAMVDQFVKVIEKII